MSANHKVVCSNLCRTKGPRSIVLSKCVTTGTQKYGSWAQPTHVKMHDSNSMMFKILEVLEYIVYWLVYATADGDTRMYRN